MASSQNQRYNERLAARQRGAGTHKVQSLGFSIQPLTLPPPPLPPAAVTSVEPSKPVTSPEVPLRRSSRTSPQRSTVERRSAGPSSPRNEANVSEAAPSRRTTLRITTRASPASSVDTPVYVTASRAPTRSTSTRSAIAAVTPVARGKRTRQPSPDKFLTTPEAARIVVRNGRSSSLASRGATESGGSVTAEKSSAGNKRRKVIREVERTLPEVEVDSDDETEGSVAQLSSVETTLVVEQEVQDTPIEKSNSPLFLRGPESSGEDGGLELELEPTPKPQPKRKALGKRPAPPPIDEDEGEEVDEHLPPPTPEPEDRDFNAGEEEGEQEDDEELSPRPTKKPAKPTTAIRSKPKPRPRTTDEDSEGGPSTFPIIVHRLGKVQGSTLPAGSQRSGVNPVDVISQVATEIIDKLYQKLKTGAERKAVESFKEELNLRFLELTDVLEHGITLTAQARQAQKRKRQLMAELLAIKRERAQVAAKMDDVRKDHEIASKSSQSQQETSQAFEEVSGALERGKSRTDGGGGGSTSMEGLEALVRKVSVTATGGGSDGTGLLARVVEFNRFLERAEQVLREKNSSSFAQ